MIIEHEKEKSRECAYVYLLRCRDASLYTGIARDVARRMKEHMGDKKGAKYTRARGAQCIEALFLAQSLAQAAKLEYAIKQLKKAQKEALIIEPERVHALFEEKLDCRFEVIGAGQLAEYNRQLMECADQPVDSL